MDKRISHINIKDIFNYKLHITVLIIFLVTQSIGVIKFSVFNTISIVILPMVFSLIISMLAYTSKKIKWIELKESQTATYIFLIILGPLIAKLAVISGANITLLVNTGPLIILEELGDAFCVFTALPIALLLGFRRKAIGMASSMCKELQMAVVIDKYGLDSQEIKGFMIVYIMGLVFGTVIISIIANIMPFILPLHPYSYALACGIGSASMNVAGVSALSVLYPELENQLIAYSAIANIISVLLSVYVFMFISLPLTEKIYSLLEKYL